MRGAATPQQLPTPCWLARQVTQRNARLRSALALTEAAAAPQSEPQFPLVLLERVSSEAALFEAVKSVEGLLSALLAKPGPKAALYVAMTSQSKRWLLFTLAPWCAPDNPNS